jgi:hypothetical protein
MDQNQELAAAAEMQIRQLMRKMLDNGVSIELLDLQSAIRKAYPGTVNVDPYARRIVAYVREHLVK